MATDEGSLVKASESVFPWSVGEGARAESRKPASLFLRGWGEVEDWKNSLRQACSLFKLKYQYKVAQTSCHERFPKMPNVLWVLFCVLSYA